MVIGQICQEENKHVEEYLDYYCGLPYPPGFAVLLKGQWGAGKTWFIDKYREKVEKNPKNKQKFLYISLYGISNISEIEDQFFKLLHSILSSKAAAITGVIAKSLLKGALHIDLNADQKNDGSWTIQIPDIDFSEHLKDVDSSILIFDDLERCNLEIDNLLGYINHFVEHQDLKVILVANEEKLDENESYKEIKEKLIGRTFAISPDFKGALRDFEDQVNQEDVKDFVRKEFDFIKGLYDKSEYKNLRSLRQIILDFDRITKFLSASIREDKKALKDLFGCLVAFSIEIKQGKLNPDEILQIQETYTLKSVRQRALHTSNETTTEDTLKESEDKVDQLQNIVDRYSPLADLRDPFPNPAWWCLFFDQGILDAKELNNSVASSKYFRDENTPDWIKLWRFRDLSDEEFKELMIRIENQCDCRKYADLGIVKHIFGLLLTLSDAKIYEKSKAEILSDFKQYILDLKRDNRLEPSYQLLPWNTMIEYEEAYSGLGFQGKDFDEFREFCRYIREVQQSNVVDRLPSLAKELLDSLKQDIWEFYKMIDPSFIRSAQEGTQISFHSVPILRYIDENDFVNSVLEMQDRTQYFLFEALLERYKDGFDERLISELSWLVKIDKMLVEEAEKRLGKLSGYRLKYWRDNYLQKIINILEKTGDSRS